MPVLAEAGGARCATVLPSRQLTAGSATSPCDDEIDGTDNEIDGTASTVVGDSGCAAGMGGGALSEASDPASASSASKQISELPATICKQPRDILEIMDAHWTGSAPDLAVTHADRVPATTSVASRGLAAAGLAIQLKGSGSGVCKRF